MKKLVSLFLSLLLCMSILASLPQAVCHAEEPEPIPVTDPTEPGDPIDLPDPNNPPIEPQEFLPDPAEESF